MVPKGMWNGQETKCFYCGGSSSKLTDNGNIEVALDSIDHVLDGEKVTFIKMDIEGSEYEALCGAKETIKAWRPRLAISVYHKPGDILVLPSLVSKLNPAYHMALRHYSTKNANETVLYAW